MAVRTRTFELDPEELVLRGLAIPETRRAHREAPLRWIDIEGASAGELVRLTDAWKMSESAIDGLLSPGQRALVSPHEDVVVARLQYVPTLDAANASILQILCFARTLVTLHDDPAPALDLFAEEFASDANCVRNSVSALFVHLLDGQVEHSISLVLQNRDRVVRMEEAVGDEDLDPADLNHDSAHLKRLGIRLATCVEDQFFCARSLERVGSRLLPLDGLRPVLDNAIANADNGQRVLERHQRRLSEARQELQIRIHDRTDGRLQLLTVISAIFLPLTLITGIYGMNFDHMPELHTAYGYPVTLGVMAVIALAMLILFKIRRWF